jgi:eukaryotic-like serine/threonine-protein kinase
MSSVISSSVDAPPDSVDSFLKQVATETNATGAAAAILPPGTTLSERFRVERFALRGGMGAIYRGRDLHTGLPVAIKTIARVDGASRARFARETSILAELSHPGIVLYLDHGSTASGTLYLVMEWLSGEDLAERLLREPLSLEGALSLLRRVCKALAFAHARGIVHRDIKPANLFLVGSDVKAVKLLDFGVARLSETEPSLTTMGARVGTVGYMSPEQALGERDLDARTDVFALGCVFYECLTGRAPFASAHPVGILAKVLQEEPARPSELRPELDSRFDDFVGKLLAKKRSDRLRDAAAVLQEFDQLMELASGPDPKVRRSLSPRRADQRIVSVILGRQDSAAVDVPIPDASLAPLEAKFGARVARLKGGALLLVLAGKGEANDRASQAALCALELSRLQPELALAVATGLVDTSGGVPVGAAIDRAALLLSEAGGQSGVMLDDVTLGLVGLRFEVQRTRGRSLLLAARRDLDGPRQLMGRPTPYVGRDRELRTLDEALNECLVDGVSRVVVITGPPGIGKSRLASEWIARGGRGGNVRTLFSRVDPTSAGSAWSLVQLLIRDAANLREADPPEAQMEALHAHLSLWAGEAALERAEFLAEIVGLRAVQEPSALLLAARGNPEIMHEQVRRALHEWLDAEAAGHPILLVLEDLHWGDAPSVKFLTEAMREQPNRPLMVVALARPEVERQFPEFCERAVMQVRLQGLGSRAAQQLIESALPGHVDAETTARLIRVADGNPFYLEELIRRVATGSDNLPETVMAMAQSRLDRLDSDTRCVLRAASVFGERCWDRGIEEVVEDHVDVQGLLKVLIDEELLLAVPDSRYVSAREYRFRHALLRDAAYAMMTREDRCAAHRAAGDWLERNGESDERQLADHFEAADARDRAGPWLVRAAKRAIDAGDVAATIELANRGIAMAASGPDRGRCLLLRCYADALSGDLELDLTREALDLLAVGTPMWWVGLAILIYGASMQGKPEEAAPYLALAREAPFASEQVVPQGTGLVTLVGGLVLLGKGSLAESILKRARQDRGERSDAVFDAFLAAAECALDAVAPVGGRWHLERALRGGQRCAQALGALGAFHGQSLVLYYTGIAATHVGLHAEARDLCLESCRVSKTSQRMRDPWPYLFLAKSYLRLRQPAEALKAIESIKTSPDRTVQQMIPIVVGEARLQQNDAAGAVLEVGAACNGISPRLRRLAACVMARAQLSLGQTNDALRTIELALDSSTTNGLESEIDLMNLKADCLLACGQRELAQRVVSRTREVVLRMAEEIEDATLKQSFLENVEPCARALAMHRQLS